MPAVDVNIKKEMFAWAIVRAGYNIEDFSKKFPRVTDWLDETKKPTVRQLEAFSRKVHLPFGYLLLPEPPQEPLPFTFFRTNDSAATKISVNVYDTLMLMQRRQNWLRDYMTEHDFPHLPFVGIAAQETNYQAIVEDIRRVLGFEKNWARHFKTWEEALEHLSNKIEEIGIIIVFNGVVENNNTRALNVAECRGFVLVDSLAPLMFVNNSDAKSAQLFTIVHELAHIWLGESAGFNNSSLLPADDPTELLCDQVAAEFLVPESSLTEFWKTAPNIRKAALNFKVSEIVIARRALDLGLITKDEFFEFYNAYSLREITKKENKADGGNFWATSKKRIGLAFAAHINQAVKTGELLYRDAYKLTGLKGNTFEKFFKEYF